jgi:hypothetical protein
MQPPHILQVFREPLKPRAEAAYDAIERETALIAARLGCPNPYLGAEALTGPKEVWYFNGYASPEDRQRVWDAYAANATLLEALTASGARKAPLTLPPIEHFARYREDLSQGLAWAPGAGRFLVIAMTNDHCASDSRLRGTVFDTDDLTRFTIAAAQSKAEADATAGAAGSHPGIFAVRPDWSCPAEHWVAADPAFWNRARTGEPGRLPVR